MATPSFDAVHTAHRSLVRTVVQRVVGPEDADDVCQEVWLRVWRHLGTWHGYAALSTWLYRVAMNYSISWLRGRRRDRLHQSLSDFGDAALATPAFIAAAPLPDREVAAARELAAVESWMLTHLSVGALEIAARVADGYRATEIADDLGLSVGTVKSRTHRVRLRLRTRRR